MDRSMGDKAGWIIQVWKQFDDALRDINKKLARALFWMRFGQAFLVLAILASWGFGVAALFWPEWAPYFYLGAIILLSIAIIPWAALISVPLRLKSVTRLIDKGYPENARELAIRAVARKLHDESIETEELLFDTAINEGRKMVRKYKEEQARDAERRDD